MSAATSPRFPVSSNRNRSLLSKGYSYWCDGCRRYVKTRIVNGLLECWDCGNFRLEAYYRSRIFTGSTDYSYRYWCYRCRHYVGILETGGESPGLKCWDCGYGQLMQYCSIGRSTDSTITDLSGGGYTSQMERYDQSSSESLRTIEINDCHVAEESHCSVCIEAFELGTKVSETPCNHIYHSHCIMQWIEYGKDSCPLCRRKLQRDVSPKSEMISTGGSSGHRGVVRRLFRGLIFSCFNGL